MTAEFPLVKVDTKSIVDRPIVTSYDSGYEHTIEHLAEVRALVEEADQKTSVVSEWYSATA